MNIGLYPQVSIATSKQSELTMMRVEVGKRKMSRTATASTNTKETEQESVSIPPVPQLTVTEEDDVNSDASSVLNLNDYSAATWMVEVMQVGVPAIGVAFLIITHPLIFLAGAGVSLLGYGGASYGASYFFPHDESDNQVHQVREGDAGVTGENIRKISLTEVSVDLPQSIQQTQSELTQPDQFGTDVDLPVSPTEDDDDYQIPIPLKHRLIHNKQFSALHARDFFKIFFSDEAPFSYQDFQKQRGDVNISYGKWNNSSNERIIRFQTPSKSPWTTYATATKRQHLRQHSKYCVVMDFITTLSDIPFAQCFNVQEQWIVTSSSEKIVSLHVSAQVNILKPCTFEKQIRSKTISTLKETLESWCLIAQKAIRISQRRQQQQDAREQQHRSLQNSDENIEVAYSEARKAPVVVGEFSDELLVEKEQEEEEDWEMDPLQSNISPSSSRSRKSSLLALRHSISRPFIRRISPANASSM